MKNPNSNKQQKNNDIYESKEFVDLIIFVGKYHPEFNLKNVDDKDFLLEVYNMAKKIVCCTKNKYALYYAFMHVLTDYIELLNFDLDDPQQKEYKELLESRIYPTTRLTSSESVGGISVGYDNSMYDLDDLDALGSYYGKKMLAYCKASSKKFIGILMI